METYGNRVKKVSFQLSDITRRETVTEADFKDTVIVINFFASWCPPCQKEIPHLNAYQKKADKGNTGVQVIGILLDEDRQKAKDYLASKQFDYPVYLPHKAMKKDKQLFVPGIGPIKGIPVTAIVDRDGWVKKVIVDTITEEQLAKAVQDVLDNLQADEEENEVKNDADLLTIQITVKGMMAASGAT